MGSIYEDLQKRVRWNDWLEIKKYIPTMPLENDQSVAPEYGYIIDKLRQDYDIYISILPTLNVNIDDKSRDLIFRFTGRILVISNSNKIEKEYTISGLNYSTVARDSINKAIDFIKESIENKTKLKGKL